MKKKVIISALLLGAGFIELNAEGPSARRTPPPVMPRRDKMQQPNSTDPQSSMSKRQGPPVAPRRDKPQNVSVTPEQSAPAKKTPPPVKPRPDKKQISEEQYAIEPYTKALEPTKIKKQAPPVAPRPDKKQNANATEEPNSTKKTPPPVAPKTWKNTQPETPQPALPSRLAPKKDPILGDVQGKKTIDGTTLYYDPLSKKQVGRSIKDEEGNTFYSDNSDNLTHILHKNGAVQHIGPTGKTTKFINPSGQKTYFDADGAPQKTFGIDGNVYLHDKATGNAVKQITPEQRTDALK